MAGTGLRMDTRAMKDLEDESFDFVFDKGTLDTLLCSCSSEASALKAIAEAHRVRPLIVLLTTINYDSHCAGCGGDVCELFVRRAGGENQALFETRFYLGG
eukprot:TRINITY_DN7038_c0_g1_i1.p2 TRINITY_DN7038_c0_g1~~TRINITY_DN7038_c0_g1_i1.p2  ORF type:complete len:101 (-),score=7.82 TRINITY_DN7038_c0_g1_i1:254-556(-)